MLREAEDVAGDDESLVLELLGVLENLDELLDWGRDSVLVGLLDQGD